MTDVVLGGILGATPVQQCPHPVLEFERVVAFGYNVVLVKDMTKKVPVI